MGCMLSTDPLTMAALHKLDKGDEWATEMHDNVVLMRSLLSVSILYDE
jgi:hypothetical protein